MTKITLVKDARDKEMLRLTDMLENAQSLMCAIGTLPLFGGSRRGLKPVSDVIVKLVSGTKTLAFTSTNAKGEYSLELKSAPSGEVTLQFFASKATKSSATSRGWTCWAASTTWPRGTFQRTK